MVDLEDIIKKGIWIGFAVIMFFVGYFIYSNPQEGADQTMTQISFHVLSGIPVAGLLIRLISRMVNDGRRGGQREINVTKTGTNTYRVSDNSFVGMMIGAVFGIAIAIAVAPILLWIMVIYNIILLIRMIVRYKNQ